VLFLLVLIGQPQAQVNSSFRISGKAVNAVTSQPLEGAEISVGSTGKTTAILQKVLTGEDGRFEFAGLPAAKYRLFGEKTGFKIQAYNGHGRYASAIAVGQANASENLVFRLRPDAGIEGKITDDENEAVQNASVILSRIDSREGYTQILPVAIANSDDRGYYHFPQLESGSYFVAVSAQPWVSPLALQQRQPGTELAADDKSLVDVAFPTAFYPGVVDSSLASPIVVGAGEEFTANFTLVAVPAVRLLVRHISSDPTLPRNASLLQRVFNLPIALPLQGGMPIDDATEIRGIAPGKYFLIIQSYGPKPSIQSTVIDINSNTEVDANSAQTAIIHGIINKHGQTLSPKAFVRLWSWKTGETVDAQIEPNEKFEFAAASVIPGTYSVFVINSRYSTNGSLSAIGAKVAGQTIQINGSTPITLTVGLPGNLATINGMARRNGQPLSGAMVILEPDDPENNLPLFRRDQTDSDGTFTLQEVLPGHYKIMAIENGWDEEWAKSAVLKTRAEHAEEMIVEPNKTYQTELNLE
jgi:hypothetical protein